MTKVVVFTSVTLDGVLQAPGRPDEDTRGGFTHGGWALPYKDLTVLGSGELVRSLRRHDLVDEYVLLIHPLVLGSGGGCSPTTAARPSSGSPTA
jgi:dihydrofolate reductase